GEGAAPGVLIPIRYLVNGRSIAQEARDEVTYWHVELARHDILLAEGLPAESYLDTGNRDAFADNAAPGDGEGTAPGDGEGTAPGDGEGTAPGDGEGTAPDDG